MKLSTEKRTHLETAVFGAGCFWGVQSAFDDVKGVKKTTVGYAGGTVKNPSYEVVCSGVTGHAEVLMVEFDPVECSYDQLLDLFWKCHDPTTLNRQGWDVGTQYRSIIFYTSEQQKRIAMDSLVKREVVLGKKVVTEIVPFVSFTRAEEYHQHYHKKKGGVC